MSILFFVRCGGSSSSTNTITDNTAAISNVPSSDATTMDYAVNSSSSVRTAAVQSKTTKIGGGSSTILVKIAHTAGEGLGTYKIFQCVDGTFMGHSSYSIQNDKYTGASFFRYGSYSTDIDMTKKVGVAITDSTFTGSVDLKFNSQARLTFSAEGSTDTNSLQGTKGDAAIACKWNSSGGCGKMQGGSAIPYSISVNSSTGAKTYSSSSDQSFCSDLTFATVAANATLSSSQTWDCTLPTGSSWNEISKSASSLEDAGGTSCKSASDSWESASADPSSCGQGTSASSVGCFCDRLYTLGVQESRRAYRMLDCKAKGIFKLIKDGSVTGTLDSGGSIYLKITSIL